MSNQHILPADYWTQHVYNITPGNEIKCFGHKIKDKKVMDNLLRQALKNIESKSSISGVRLTADVDPSDLTKKTNVMVRKATDSVAKLKQQAEEDTKQALQTIKAVQTKAIKRNVTAGSTSNPTMATPTVPSSGSKSTVMTTSSDGSEAKANPTVRDALVSLQTAVGDQAEEFQKTVTDTVQGAAKAAGDAVAAARETAAATITNAAKAISPTPATETTPAAASDMGGGRRRTKRRKRRRKHKTKHKRKKKRTTRKRKKRTRRRRR